MGKNAHAIAADLHRLDAMVKHLKIGKRWVGIGMIADVKAACLEQVAPVLSRLPTSGELVADKLAHHYSVKFEEVRTTDDIDRLEVNYLQKKNELGFAQLREEVLDPEVDALLFMRTNAAATDRDRWVAILNMLYSRSRAYWNMFHELSHRITEPPQLLLPFRRNRAESENTVKYVIDQVAAGLAFYEPIFRPLVVAAAAHGQLTFTLVHEIRKRFAPTASLQAVTNAVVKYWPKPAICFTGKINGRVRNPAEDRALRIQLQARNEASIVNNFCPHPNMRIPQSSPAFVCHKLQSAQQGQENLSTWTTSGGGCLPNIQVWTSAESVGDMVYVVMSA